MSLQRRVIVGVFGATTGLTVSEFSPDGAREIGQSEIPWQGDAREGIYWPMDWLVDALEGLRRQARPGDVMALGMPGADLMIASPEDTPHGVPHFPLQHYRGVMDSGAIEKATALLSPEETYRRTGGANLAAFQPYAQLSTYKSRHPGLLEEATTIVPLCDWMTAFLCGQTGHDPVMLQDQGLTCDGKAVCEHLAGLPGLSAKITPWKVFEDGRALETPEGFYLMPVTHDSVPARMAGYSASPWVIWTGTWVGTACQVKEIMPSKEAFEAGIAFEGWGPSLSAITNVAMAGRLYKTLVQDSGWSFEEAATLALDRLPTVEGKSINIARLPADEALALTVVTDSYGTDRENQLAGIVGATAAACSEKIDATARLLGLKPPEEVAIIGGWARNRAFIAALKHSFKEVKIPPQAPAATAVGLAAEALVGVGDAGSVREALAMLPQLEG